jgi:hypothetical protein
MDADRAASELKVIRQLMERPVRWFWTGTSGSGNSRTRQC